LKSKTTSIFPDPNSADPQGFLCAGGKLTPEVLIDAYGHGIFPWPQEGQPILWFSPPERGVLDFQDFRVPRRFQQERKKMTFDVTKNRDFAQVIENCARVPRKGEQGTWILPEMQRAYLELHSRGIAQSYEAWDGERLVGGLYGVVVNGLFSGESMFFKASGASKLCLVTMIEDRKFLGESWVDIQMVTPVLKSFGGRYILREDFLARLKGF